MQPETETVIVGASAAGLATAACLKKRGRPFELLEAATQVGPAWRKHYQRLHLHTAKWLSGLPFVGFPREMPTYPAREQVVAYLEAYARTLALEPRFGERVGSIRPDGQGWIVRTSAQEWRARNVVVATGYTRVPNRPTWPGLEQFAGRVLHSSEYGSGAEFAGKRVLVVGFGNSGGEIALDLFEQGARAAIALRSPLNVIPREFLGLPITGWGMLLGLLPDSVADAITRVVSRIKFGRLDALGIRALPYGAFTQVRRRGRIPLIDVGTLARIRSREIELLPGVESFDASGVRFTGGLQRPFDAVILATGYRPAVGDFLESKEGALDDAGVPLKSGDETLPGLYFCGFRVVPSGMLFQLAREAKRIARSIAAKA